ncbi:MAG TPA: hypothetical protein VJ576_15685 [Rhodocyclaceae bacterium]|nr:hypothetical protein [Rhodocyclaceae bacterium]
MLKNDKRIAAVFGYCATVISLLAVTPWVDWAKDGNAWVANLAALPALPAILLIFRRNRLA